MNATNYESPVFVVGIESGHQLTFERKTQTIQRLHRKSDIEKAGDAQLKSGRLLAEKRKWYQCLCRSTVFWCPKKRSL